MWPYVEARNQGFSTYLPQCAAYTYGFFSYPQVRENNVDTWNRNRLDTLKVIMTHINEDNELFFFARDNELN